MKNLLIIFLLSATLVNAQPYQSVFGQNETNHTSDWYGLGIGAVYYGIKGDTLIDAKDYKKVSISWNHGIGYSQSIGFLREDTITGKVWYRHLSNDTIDYLVMDMSLKAGDTFYIGKTIYTQDIAVVDTVYIQNTRKHIEFNVALKYNLSNNWYSLSFIEGVGTALGLCYKDTNILPQNSSTNEFNGKVFCFYKDGSRIYSMPVVQDYNDSCRPPLNIKNLKSVALNIYPNPTSNIFHINIPHAKSKVVVTDIVGREVYDFETIQQTKLSVDMTGKNRGIYLVKIINDNGNAIGKVVVQ